MLKLLFTLLLAAPLAAATTMNNDDSCDITLAPAATLLLPFFEVSLPDGSQKTIFTIINVTAVPQIAHVTIWTDWSFPILSFNLFLTGYDVQAIDLADVLLRGIIAPPAGTSATDRRVSPNPSSGVPGTVPDTYVSNPNITREAVAFGGACSTQTTQLPADLLNAVQMALTGGLYPQSCGNRRVGGAHANARGYVTIDVVNTCTARYPDDPQYLLKELLYDNALIGDYQDVHSDPTVGNLAQGNPMVHIRAIPEGGSAGSHYGSNLPYTFYDRFTIALPGQKQRTFDRRQPLPSVFAARWIESGTGGDLNTSYKIWREGIVAGTQNCSTAFVNSAMDIGSYHIIRFDERENSWGLSFFYLTPGPTSLPTLPAAARVATNSLTIFAPNGSAYDVSGWMFLDLNNGGVGGYSANGRTGSLTTPFAPAGSGTLIRPSQNWVIVSMSAQGRYSVDFDAAMLGNGCTPAAILDSRIAPAANVNPSGHVD